MAKKKAQKKEEVIIENIEKEIVSFDIVEKESENTDIDKTMEEIDSLIEDITPIDMSEELKEIQKEIFEEPKKEEEVVVEEEHKTIKEKIIDTTNRMFGFVWNGMEFD